MEQTIDGVLIGARESRMLEQASPILVGHAVTELDVERNDAHLRRITADTMNDWPCEKNLQLNLPDFVTVQQRDHLFH